MIARDWGQFMEFMESCEKAQVEVLCLDEVEDAGRIFQRIQKFIAAYFEGKMCIRDSDYVRRLLEIIEQR